MTCQLCGHSSPMSSALCTNCGQPHHAQAAFAATVGGAQPFSRPTNNGVIVTPSSPVARSTDTTPYAPFLKRFAAFFADELIAGAIAALTYLIVAAMAATSSASTLHSGYGGGFRTGVELGAGFLFLISGGFLALAVYVYYFVKQETSSRQATLGKSLLGLRVTTTSGSTISVGQSLGRLIIKSTFSGLFFALGFLMAAFTDRKQALHDFIAGTIVVHD